MDKYRIYLFILSFLSETDNSVERTFFNGGNGFDFNGPRDPLLGPGPGNLDLTLSVLISDFEFSRDKFSKNAKLFLIPIFSSRFLKNLLDKKS